MDSYYTRFPGRKVWAQGDFIYQDTTTKGLEILGRSDGVLNPVRTSPLPTSPFFFSFSSQPFAYMKLCMLILRNWPCLWRLGWIGCG